jgi:hypothetical protein
MASVEMDTGEFRLIEFDTQREDGISTDFCSYWDENPVSGGTYPHLAGRTVQIIGDGVIYNDQVVPVGGLVTIPDAVNALEVGVSMPGYVTLTGAVANTARGPLIGRDLCISGARFLWRETSTGTVDGEDIVNGWDDGLFDIPLVDEWREYWPSIWGPEPELTLAFESPGTFAISAYVLNVRA